MGGRHSRFREKRRKTDGDDEVDESREQSAAVSERRSFFLSRRATAHNSTDLASLNMDIPPAAALLHPSFATGSAGISWGDSVHFLWFLVLSDTGPYPAPIPSCRHRASDYTLA
jgi:hypothetical protein